MRTSTPKGRVKLQQKLGEIKQKNLFRGCWVCGSRDGLKTHREARGPRCRDCFTSGRTTPEVQEYERLRGLLEASKEKR